MRIDVVTLFPSMFRGVLRQSILKIARDKGLAKIGVHDLRRYSPDRKHHKVDAPPYGGGPGMVIQAEPVFAAVEKLKGRKGCADATVVLLTPAGIPYDQAMAEELSQQKSLIVLCGHYEGFDERVSEGLHPLEISVGDYVLTGGEIPAMVLLDSVVRLLPGVLGSAESLLQESFTEGRLEYPHYTRPREFRGMKVPDVLLGGDHAKIEAWRKTQSEERTRERRADLTSGQVVRRKKFRQL